ncbi:MAG TPA: lipocalin-like domain-containing protein [Steroidobacteraceae bacterium]
MSKVLFVLVLTLCALPTLADDRKTLVGVWRYAGEVDTKADGSSAPTSALGDTQGLLIYTAEGFVSVVLMPKARTWLSETATMAELRETVVNGTAYAGRYELDPNSHTITHITSVSMEPAFEEKRLVRQYTLEGNTLKLKGTFPYDGETIHFTITWVRVDESRN